MQFSEKLAFAAACVAIPIVWGWLVHWLFTRYGRRRASLPETLDGAEDDYQI